MKNKILAIFTAALMLTGVATQQAKAGDAGVFGTVLGAATGGFIGSHVGGGDGRLAATAAGTLLGAMIGHEMGAAVDARPRYETMRGTVYRKPAYNRTIYKPVRVATPPPAPKRKVVVKKQVTVIHVHPERKSHAKKKRWAKKKWDKKRKWEREQRRRELAWACYDHPRRCAKAF